MAGQTKPTLVASCRPTQCQVEDASTYDTSSFVDVEVSCAQTSSKFPHIYPSDPSVLYSHRKTGFLGWIGRSEHGCRLGRGTIGWILRIAHFSELHTPHLLHHVSRRPRPIPKFSGAILPFYVKIVIRVQNFGMHLAHLAHSPFAQHQC